MSTSLAGRPGAAEKTALEIFTDTLIPVLEPFDEGGDLNRQVESIAGEIVRAVFAGCEDLAWLAPQAVAGQFVTLSLEDLKVASDAVIAAFEGPVPAVAGLGA
jgi:dihydrodipicolinate synthase/N-acetylneuraminate lyase